MILQYAIKHDRKRRTAVPARARICLRWSQIPDGSMNLSIRPKTAALGDRDRSGVSNNEAMVSVTLERTNPSISIESPSRYRGSDGLLHQKVNL